MSWPVNHETEHVVSNDTLKKTKDELKEEAVTLKNVTKYVAETIKDVKDQAKAVEETKAGVEKAADRVERAIEAAERIEALLSKVSGKTFRSEVLIWIYGLVALLAVVDPLNLLR